MIIELSWAFVTGLAGSLHCLGMCGPLVFTYSLHLRREGTGQLDRVAPGSYPGAIIYHHAAFQGGRIAAYALTGAVTAGLVSLAGSVDSLRALRSPLSVAGGVGMVIFGLILLKVLPSSRRATAGSLSGSRSFLGRALANLLRSQTLRSRGVLGFAAGFLPCMLSWAMVVKAAATGNAVTGFSLMAVFGLGTAPALLFAGFFASLFTLKTRLAGERIAALSVIAMGLILVWKGASRLV